MIPVSCSSISASMPPSPTVPLGQGAPNCVSACWQRKAAMRAKWDKSYRNQGEGHSFHYTVAIPLMHPGWVI